MKFKPLLAAPVDLDKLKFPVLASPKLDGIRAIMHPDLGLVSRNLKPIPNAYVRRVAEESFPSHIDGELIMLKPDGSLEDFSSTTSGIMSMDGNPDFRFVVFDSFKEPLKAFKYRHADASLDAKYAERCEALDHELIDNIDDLMVYEQSCVDQGYEGTMLRHPDAPYKFGRSTVNQGTLLKMKRFHDAEAKVVGVVERMLNKNEQVRDNLGYAKRSTSKAGKVPADDLGALVCEYKGVQFDLGTGFTAAQRVEYWGDHVIGELVKFKYQELSKDGVPRFPVFLGFRNEGDL